MKASRAVAQKAFAVACIVLVLGLQAWTIFPPGSRSRDRHWPFLNYPMYSRANHRGDSVVMSELRAVPCGRPDTTLPVRASVLRIELGRYWDMMRRLSRPDTPQRLLDTLSRLTRAGIPVDVCGVELWRQVLILEQRGVRLEESPWTRFRQWTIEPDSSRRSVKPSHQ